MATVQSSSNAAVVLGGIDPIQRSVLGGKPLCKHVHSATGCALRSQCPLAHTGANGAMSAAAAEMDRLRRDAESSDDRHPVWLYRENACAGLTGGVAWRRFSASYTETLEAAFARWTATGSAQPTRRTLDEAYRGPPLSTASAAEVRLTGSMSVALDTMAVFNRIDSGQRRPVQRVLLSPIPVWFAVPVAPPTADSEGPGGGLAGGAPTDVHADEVIRIAPATAAMLEFDYVTGLRSFFGLLAHEEPAWVNLCRMRLTYLDGRAYHLHRQAVAAVPGSAPSDMHGHALLRSRGSLAAAVPLAASARAQGDGASSFDPPASANTTITDPTPVVQCRLTDHRVRADAAANMTERGAPAAFDLEEVVPSLAAPTKRCEGLRCVQRRGAAHLHTALHPCPNGTRAECFLCSAAATIRGGGAAAAGDASDFGGSSFMGQSALRRQSLLSPVGMGASMLLPKQQQPGEEGVAAAALSPELAARAQVHAALFVSPQLAGGSASMGGTADADDARAAGAEAAHEWRQRQRLHVELRRSWLAACAPEKAAMSRSRAPSKGPTSLELPPQPPGSAGGGNVVQKMDTAVAPPLPGLVHVADDSAEHSGLLEYAAVADATPEPRTVRVQRIPAGERYHEYLRWRNEAFEQWAAVDAEAAVASDEGVLYAPLKVADDALRWPDAADGPRGTLLFRTFAAALDRAVSAADTEADEERRKGRPGALAARHHDHVAVVVTYSGPPAPRHDAGSPAVDAGAPKPPIPFVVREAVDRRRCLVATSEVEGSLAVRHHDASQFAPLYLVSVSREPAVCASEAAELLARTESMATASSASRRPKTKKTKKAALLGTVPAVAPKKPAKAGPLRGPALPSPRAHLDASK